MEKVRRRTPPRRRLPCRHFWLQTMDYAKSMVTFRYKLLRVSYNIHLMSMRDVEHIVEGTDHMIEGDGIVDGNVTTAIQSGCRSSVRPHSRLFGG